MVTFISNSAEETAAIGHRYAKTARAGDIFALSGDLGAGKTQFVKGFAEGLGSDAAVTSPTFTIGHEYPGGRLPIYHFDFFRLEDRQSVERLGLDEYFLGAGISVIEWADKFPELIPAEAQRISFEMKSENVRIISARLDAIRESRIALRPNLK